MLSLNGIKDWLKTLGVGDFFYVGKMDNKKEKAIGVYQRKVSGEPTISIGGLLVSKYEKKSVSVLVHWNNSATETEQASFSLFEKLLNAKNIVIDGYRINYLRLMVSEPQDVGTDENGIFERVIWFDLYFERRK